MAIIGGAKVSSKLAILENLVDKVDRLMIGGGMAYTFILAQGGNVGNSLVEEDMVDRALAILKKAADRGVEVFLPNDSTCVTNSQKTQTLQSTLLQKSHQDGWA